MSGVTAWQSALAAACAFVPVVAMAEEPQGPAFDLEAAYTADVVTTFGGQGDSRARYLDNLDLVAAADLGRIAGWDGATLHLHVLANQGGRPNDAAGTLEGIDNIEVGKAGVRLFEAWIEQTIGPGSIRAGLYDLNSEFYALDAAGVLVGPAFGIGSELAASGSNGPSIFPSTALGVRVQATVGAGGYLQAALLNARAGTIGDRGGVDLGFDRGLLVIAEGGWRSDAGALGAGAWSYTRDGDGFAGEPARRRPSRGAYLQAEGRLAGESLRGFARVGWSDGRHTAFVGSGQAGVLLGPAIADRADSAVSLGAHYALTSRAFRDDIRAAGEAPADAEITLEATYSDRLAPFLTVQPDLQYVIHPGGRANAGAALVALLRVIVDMP